MVKTLSDMIYMHKKVTAPDCNTKYAVYDSGYNKGAHDAIDKYMEMLLKNKVITRAIVMEVADKLNEWYE